MMAALLPLQHAWNSLKFSAPQARVTHDFGLNNSLSFQHQMSPGEIEGAVEAPVARSRGVQVEVRNLCFRHDGSEKDALNSVSFRIERGQHVAIVGPSGAGKTTLAEIILGIAVPNSGSVLIDGVRSDEPKCQALNGPGYVAQSPGLVGGSFLANIAFGQPTETVDEARAWEALDTVGLSEYVRELPQKIHTNLGKQVDNLSGGQKQRLGLARAIYRDTRLLVLDEATSNLDMESERYITKAVQRLGDRTTVITIAHRLATIQEAEKVLVLDDGSLIASGTFAQVKRAAPLVERYIALSRLGVH